MTKRGGPTRIGVVLPNLVAIGAQRYVLGLVRQLEARGFQCDILLQSPGGAFLPEVRESQLRSFAYRSFQRVPRIRTVEAMARLAMLLHSERYDSVLSVTPFLNRAICFFKSVGVLQSRVVIEEHGYPPLYINVADGMRPQAVWFYSRTFGLYHWADAIRVISGGIADYYKTRGLTDNVRFFPNLIDLDRIREMGDASSLMQLPSDVFNVVYFGRLSTQKNVEYLVHGFAYLADKLNAHLWIVGDGDQRAKLTSLVAALDLEDRVSFLGFLENPYPLIRQAQVLALTSTWEGSPQVLVESMLLRVPVVSIDCPTGPADMIGESERGWLVPFGSEPAVFGATLEKVALDPIERAHRARRAEDFVGQQYNLSARADEYISLFLDPSWQRGSADASHDPRDGR